MHELLTEVLELLLLARCVAQLVPLQLNLGLLSGLRLPAALGHMCIEVMDLVALSEVARIAVCAVVLQQLALSTQQHLLLFVQELFLQLQIVLFYADVLFFQLPLLLLLVNVFSLAFELLALPPYFGHVHLQSPLVGSASS